MIKRIFAYLLPIVMIISFIYLMTSGESLKRPRSRTDDVSAYFQKLEQDLYEENWSSANDSLNDLENALGIVVARIQYSVAREDIVDLERNLARVRGNIRAEEKAGALSELSEALYYWNILGN